MDSQFFYHIFWHHGGSPTKLNVSTEGRLSYYPEATTKSVVFDNYQDISAKDHERMWRASEVAIDYDLSVESHLPKRDVIMRSKLASALGSFNLGENTTVETGDDCNSFHDEADVTMVPFLLEAA